MNFLSTQTCKKNSRALRERQDSISFISAFFYKSVNLYIRRKMKYEQLNHAGHNRLT